MEDLWRIQNCGVDVEDFADYAEYKRFLNRFNLEEEKNHRQRILVENARVSGPDSAGKDD